MYFKHTPDIIKPLAKDLTFELPNDRREIYLTFDDGPHPEITSWVMQQLKAFDAHATFFLVGKMVEQNPEMMEALLEAGHSVGHHGYSHLSGWKAKDATYFEDIRKGAELVKSKLFRPPYGQISLSQSRKLKANFKIIMWSDLSADFDAQYSAEQCLHFATNKVKSGSIIVCHDSEKAWPRLKEFLPQALEYYRNEGFVLEALPMD